MTEQPARPVDVGTAFGLWLVALVLLIAGQAIDMVLAPDRPRGPIVFAITAMFLICVAAIVVTFLFLMRQGYGWARTLLTGGGVSSVVYVGISLFTVRRDDASAVLFAATGIVGSVLIAGGLFLVHRKDAQAFFTR